MRKNTKRWIASAAALGLLTGGAVFAAEPVDENVVAVPEDSMTEEAPAVVNGAALYNVAVQDVNGVTMIPLREVAEGLGYTVTWNGENESIEVIKGAQYITMSIDQDSYAFSRRAPQSLGAAPTLVNDSVTYVPLSFITDIIGGYYSVNEDGSYKIVNPSIVTVSEVQEDGSLLVTDSYLGEVIVRIDENTKITGAGQEASAKDIKKDMVLAIEYAPAMTMSIPPQTTAVTIDIQNLPVENEEGTEEPEMDLTFKGEITSIDDGLVTIGVPFEDDDALRLVISDETQITKGNGKRVYKLEDLEVGMVISGTHSEPMTMSIPPQTVALTVNIEDEGSEEEAETLESVAFEGEITAIDGDIVTVGVPFEDNDAICLVISDKTQITKGNDKRIYKIDDLEVGMKISGTHSAATTRSIPPQSAAITVEIAD